MGIKIPPHTLQNTYPLEVQLHYTHNHTITSADAMRFRPVSEETKQHFTKRLNEDVSQISAYRRVLEYYDDKVDDYTVDRYHVSD